MKAKMSIKLKKSKAAAHDAQAMQTFVALDFETADYERDSACAIGIVKVVGNKVVEKIYRLIRPPRKEFVFTYLHGIAWKDVAKEPPFNEVWSEVSETLKDVDFIAAHNATFDQGVLEACCHSAGIKPPKKRFVCTVGLARQIWNIRPTKLDNVCRYLKIQLKHHEALSDAEACAKIVLAARKTGANI
ncbi:MAG: 3'-5' exonuclease [Planctomycetota bacterium]